MCLKEIVEEPSVADSIDLSHLNMSKKAEVLELVERYKPLKLIKSAVEMKLILKDDIPVFQRPRQVSYENTCFIETQVQKWLEEGIIVPSCSDYASPVVLVTKKDGSKGFLL